MPMRTTTQRSILLGTVVLLLVNHAYCDAVVDCGCPSTCTEVALSQHADGRQTCRDLILTEMSKLGSKPGKKEERLACLSVSRGYPLVCGSKCDPNHCTNTGQGEASTSRKKAPTKRPTGGKKPRPITYRNKSLGLLKNITEPVRNTDVPFYLHIFKSAGSTMKGVMHMCYGLSIPHQTKESPSLEVVKRKGEGGLVNVATSSPETIIQAKKMGLVESNVADVIVAPFLYNGALLFNQNQRGRMFAIFRHPIERAVSLFYYLCHAKWESTYNPALCNYSLREYAERVAAGKGLGRDNFLVRNLSGKAQGPVTDEDLAVAIEVLQTKFLVGLMSEMDESVKRFETFFGWNRPNQKCMNKLLHDKPVNQYPHKKAVEGSEEYEMLATQNLYDLKLYEAAVATFRDQRKLFA